MGTPGRKELVRAMFGDYLPPEPWDYPVVRGQEEETFPAETTWRSGQRSRSRTSAEHFSLHLTVSCMWKSLNVPLLLSRIDQCSARRSVPHGRRLGPSERAGG